MNETQIQIPAGLKIAPDVKIEVPYVSRGADDEFENALADAQDEWEAAHPELTPEQKAELAAYQAAEADATYGGTAQSAYQAAAEAIEEARSLSVAFAHGVGEEAAAYLRYAAGERIVVQADEGKNIDAKVNVASVPGAVSAAAIDVIAGPSSEVNLSIVVDGRQGDQGDDDDEAFGIAGTTVRVFADKSSVVNIVRTQTLGEKTADIDDMGLFTAADARVNVRQTVLGAQRTYTGLAGDLRGDRSRMDVDTRYLGHGTQAHDFNYSLRHHGCKTECNLVANGVLAGKSSKVLRGTIDLIRGCKGAQGSENETVLLVDKDVTNKTVPVILCNEDDVAGNHGATIGHVRDEQLFYLASRGLSQEDAERMFVSAIVEQAAIDAPDEAARAAVVRLGERASSGFSELFED